MSRVTDRERVGQLRRLVARYGDAELVEQVFDALAGGLVSIHERPEGRYFHLGGSPPTILALRDGRLWVLRDGGAPDVLVDLCPTLPIGADGGWSAG